MRIVLHYGLKLHRYNVLKKFDFYVFLVRLEHGLVEEIHPIAEAKVVPFCANIRIPGILLS